MVGFALVLAAAACSDSITDPHLEPLDGPKLALSGQFTCAILDDDSVNCWGAWGGAPGFPPTEQPPTRLPPLPDGSRFVGLYAGALHTCGLTGAGVAYCWGWNTYGQLGDGTTQFRLEPTRVATDEAFVSLATGSFSTCGLNAQGRVFCWGRNDLGQLGHGVSGEGELDPTPRPVSGSARFERIAGGAPYCALSVDHQAFCWGGAAGSFEGGVVDGRCDDGFYILYSTGPCTRPTAVRGAPRFAGLAVGGAACGWTESGEAWCWGEGWTGILGVGEAYPSLVAVEPRQVVGGLAFDEVAMGGGFSCGLADGQAYCWGVNMAGELGRGYLGSDPGDTHSTVEPGPVLSEAPFVRIVAGGRHSCAVDASGSVWCWGNNAHGQLGRPSSEGASTVPVKVEGVVAASW